MVDTALENAESLRKQLLEHKKKLLAEIIGIDDQLSRVARFIKDWHDFAGTPMDAVVHVSVNAADARENKPASIHTQAATHRRPRNPPREEVAAAARDIIQERKEPVSRSDLFTELRSRGFVITGKDPEMVLSTMLWRSRDRIVRLKGGGYWLREVPHPESGYEPDSATDMDDILNWPASEILDPDGELGRDTEERASEGDDDIPVV